jgi:putative SOS response-associated peptidase YedK
MKQPQRQPRSPIVSTPICLECSKQLAGIFDRWADPENEGRELLSCSMMTTEPNPPIAKVHDRQVVTLRPDQFTPWLDGSAGTEMLVPAPDDAIRYWPVSKRINNVRTPRDDKTLIEPVELAA